MNRFVKALIPALLVAAGAYFYITAIPDSKRPQFYSGTFIIKPAGETAKGEAVRIIEVIQQRLKNGNYPAKTRSLPDGTTEFSVEKITDTVQIKLLFTKRGLLQFRPAFTQTDIYGNLEKAKEMLLAENSVVKQKQIVDTGTSNIQSLLTDMEISVSPQSDDGQSTYPLLSFFERQNSIYPYIGILSPDDTARLRSLLMRTEVRTGSINDPEYYFGYNDHTKDKLKTPSRIYVYALTRLTSLQGTVIDNSDLSGAKIDFDYMNKPVVAISFTGFGTKKWAKITGENLYKPIAMLIDDSIVSAPLVEQKLESGSSIISANFTPAEAKAIADILSAPPLPAPVQLVSAKLQKTPRVLSTREILTILGAFALAFGLGLFVIKTFEQNKQG